MAVAVSPALLNDVWGKSNLSSGNNEPYENLSVNLRSWADELKDNDKVLDRPWV